MLDGCHHLWLTCSVVNAKTLAPVPDDFACRVPPQLPATAGVQSGPLSRDPQGAAFMQQYYSAYGVAAGAGGGGPQGRLLRAGDGDPKVHSDSEVRRSWTTCHGAAGSSSGTGGSGMLHDGGWAVSVKNITHLGRHGTCYPTALAPT